MQGTVDARLRRDARPTHDQRQARPALIGDAVVSVGVELTQALAVIGRDDDSRVVQHPLPLVVSRVERKTREDPSTKWSAAVPRRSMTPVWMPKRPLNRAVREGRQGPSE